MNDESLIGTAINRSFGADEPVEPVAAPKAKPKAATPETHEPRQFADSDFHWRYIAYAKAHGNTPQAQHEADGRQMAGFINWINNRWEAWCALTNQPAHAFNWNNDLGLFDKWLDQAGAA